MEYRDFYEHATGFPPYPYQEELAQGDFPQLVRIPTGLGKTSAIILAWLYKQWLQTPDTSRRLVYTLPMRALVEQTHDSAAKWLKELSPQFEAKGIPTPTIHKMMGGDMDESWQANPAASSILIGTQDMLLSRALNRGYGMSRFRWPMHFSLLNNDALWVFDEPQLMGVGVETGAQLQGLREKLGVCGNSQSLWMSATLDEEQMKTVDHPEPKGGRKTLCLDESDLEHERVKMLLQSKKQIHKEPLLRLDQTSKKQYPKMLAEKVQNLHEEGTFTLIIVNRVTRAQDIYKEVLKVTKRAPQNTILLHSRFRPSERALLQEQITKQQTKDLIVIATQAIEAGIDISADLLLTELAPWPSLVQRMGRCNRRGSKENAEVHWIDLDADDANYALPYFDKREKGTSQPLHQARQILQLQRDGSPEALSEVEHQPPLQVRPILRKKDLFSLFDTTPDLLGDDIDISRFIRDDRDTDIQLFWRIFPAQSEKEENTPPDPKIKARREELCSVSIGNTKDFVKKVCSINKKKQKGPKKHIWRKDHLSGAWISITNEDECRPGQILLVDTTLGGYDKYVGWIGKVAAKETEHTPVCQATPESKDPKNTPDSIGADPGTEGNWLSLKQHLDDVRQATCGISATLPLSNDFLLALEQAALWHDVGKAHEAFQAKLGNPPQEGKLWAKSAKMNAKPSQTTRPYFRHELASALAWIAHNPEHPQCDLIAYLIAAHHGKVRLSIRALPQEKTLSTNNQNEPTSFFARGLADGDQLPEVTLTDGTKISPIALDLSIMQMGQGSWLERTSALCESDVLGPFRLGYLEMVLRAADWKASAESQGAKSS